MTGKTCERVLLVQYSNWCCLLLNSNELPSGGGDLNDKHFIVQSNTGPIITDHNQNIWMQNDCILLFSMLSGNRSVIECVLVSATLSQSCWRVIQVRLWGACDAAAEGYACWMEGKLDGCKWALSLNGAVFLFMKDWLSRGMEGMNEICMERLYCTRPPAGLAINLSSVASVCVGSSCRSTGQLTADQKGQDDVWPHGVNPQTDTDWLHSNCWAGSDKKREAFNLLNPDFTIKGPASKELCSFINH